MLNVPVPVKVEAPVTPKVELRVVAPVTPRIPPKEVAPVPTVKVLEPVTLVAPFRLILPVAVEKLPVPVCEKLPKVWEMLLLKVATPVTPRVEFKVVAPVTPNVPPRLVLPELTVKFLEPVIVVSPFKETLPVPVLNVPVPD